MLCLSILIFDDWHARFILVTDVPNCAIGAVLVQETDGKLNAIITLQENSVEVKGIIQLGSWKCTVYCKVIKNLDLSKNNFNILLTKVQNGVESVVIVTNQIFNPFFNQHFSHSH